jgi:hypothetical protein
VLMISTLRFSRYKNYGVFIVTSSIVLVSREALYSPFVYASKSEYLYTSSSTRFRGLVFLIDPIHSIGWETLGFAVPTEIPFRPNTG